MSVSETYGEAGRLAAKGAYAPGASRAAFAAFAVLFAAAWAALDGFFLSPSFGGTDIYYFKDAGINLSEGLGFVSRFTFGNPTFDYQVYSQYPPLYPLLFGGFVKLFGVSTQSNQIFNTLIDVATGVIGFLALRPLIAAPGEKLSAYVLAAVFVVSVVFGFFLPLDDRPDGLAVSLSLISLILVRQGARPAHMAAAGALCAVIFFISPYVAIWSAVAAAIVAAAQRDSLKGVVSAWLQAGAGGLAVGAALILLIGIFLPGWFSGFLGVFTGTSTNKETGGGYFLLLLRGDVAGWLGGFNNADALDLVKLAIAQAAVLVALLWSLARNGWRAGIGWTALLLALSPLCAILVPYQGNYMRLTAMLLLAAVASMALLFKPAARTPYLVAVVAAFLFGNLLSLPDEGRVLLIRTQLAPSLARAEAALSADAARFKEPSVYFATAPQQYMLLRQEGLRPLITTYSGFTDPEARARLSYILATYTGSGDPLAPKMPDFPVADEFVLVEKPALPQIPRLFGVPLSRSSQTWEPAIYARQQRSETR